MPLIRLYQYPVTLFVHSGSVGAPGYLTWKELRELVLEGVDIGNHSSSHDHLIDAREGETREQWSARVRQDIEKAQLQFEKHLKLTPELFAYPYGEYSLALAELVQQMGFAAAFCQQSGAIHGGSDLMTLPRFPMGGPFATLKGFREKVAMEPLLVSVERPADPVLEGNNPPVLELLIEAGKADLDRMNCYVQGDNRCKVEAIKDRPGAYRVTAEKPLTGRRNKYTLTAPFRNGSGWHWYSHLWINSAEAMSFVK
jgi:peptidoglycan/xylan/chitin deacetylase (PgdA/CDA1 family)